MDFVQQIDLLEHSYFSFHLIFELNQKIFLCNQREKSQDIFDKEDIFNRAKEMSPYFQDGLHSLKDLKEIVSIRGYGMMGGIEMRMRDKPGKSGFQTFKHCYDAGVNFKNTGDSLIIAPQFICEKKHIDEIIEKLRTGITNYSKS